ncbi:penicillin-binding protein [Lactobacillus sp. DCY120]|uniref:Penicillin-binding protein n=1 Tax=Bombilactobacillus apium TaxID=2675299 RepID=A0A850R8X3_9LACO|nr:transglycosylase domain-containing protein [Bombilactobacillus apium]NVY97182.1 penicillin-binding protein [Bombilactobacillus apium]
MAKHERSNYDDWRNKFIDSQSDEQHPTVVNPADLPTTTAGKINLTLSIIRRLFLALIVGLILVLGLILGLSTGYLAALINKEPIPSSASLQNKIENVDQSTTLYFANHVKMERVPSDVTRKKVDFQHVSPNFKKAIIATEDENFYQHRGFVPKSLIRAIASEVTGLGTQTGGSTLTQQLVKMQILSSETTWKRKATEILLAMRLEKHFSKDQVLQAYFNAVPLGRNNKGQNIAGVQAAAQGIFNTAAENLTLAQAAFIAGLPQSPSVYTPYDNQGQLKDDLSLGLKRKNVVLFRMYRNGDISQKQYQEAKKVDLKEQFAQPESAPSNKIKYGYLYNLLTSQLRVKLMKQLAQEDNLSYREVQQNKDLYQVYYQKADQQMRAHNYHVYSTINKDLYENMQKTFDQHKDQLGTTHSYQATDPNTGKIISVHEPVQNGSVLLDNQTGAILSFVGGQDFNDNQTNHAFDTQRSPGSAIKPLLVYGPAIDQGLIGSKTMLADFKAKFGKYRPTDYGRTIENKFVAADEALAQSLNLPAVNLYNQVVKKANPKSYLEKMGLQLKDSEYRQLGLALGGTKNGLTVNEMASAFSTFANQGQHTASYSISQITDSDNQVIYQHRIHKKRVFTPATSYIMQKMLRGVVKTGTASQLPQQLEFDSKSTFGKTGTSNDFRDNWFIGSTPGLTLASWTGYDNLYGHNYNLQENSTDINQELWANLMNNVAQTDPNLLRTESKMSRPSGVVSQQVLKETGTKPGTVTYNGYPAQLNQETTTSLFYNGHAQDLSRKFGIGGSSKNYQLFWDHYFGKQNGYGIKKHLGESSENTATENSSPSSTTTTTPDQSTSVMGGGSSATTLPSNQNRDSSTNSEVPVTETTGEANNSSTATRNNSSSSPETTSPSNGSEQTPATEPKAGGTSTTTTTPQVQP